MEKLKKELQRLTQRREDILIVIRETDEALQKIQSELQATEQALADLETTIKVLEFYSPEEPATTEDLKGGANGNENASE